MGEKNVTIVPLTESIPDSLIAGLADRDVSVWVSGAADDPAEVNALAAMLRLPWRQVFIEDANPRLISALEAEVHEDSSLVRRRGFIHIIDTDPSRVDLPTRALPVYLLAGRDGRGSTFEKQLRRMTMLAELQRSGVRRLVVVGGAKGAAPTALQDIWADGFRTRLVVVNKHADAVEQLRDWLDANGQGPTSSIVSFSAVEFATRLAASFASAHEDENLTVRQRDDTGAIHLVNLTDVDDPERPILESYDLILDRNITSASADDLPEEAFNAFFRGELDNWRAFAAGLPWVRDDGAWLKLQAQLSRLDSVGSSENRITYIMSEPGAGGTTLARYLAFTAARAGYPTLVAKELPFTPEALPIINFLTRARQRSEDLRSVDPGEHSEPDARLYETPWLLVFDRVHWEFRDVELRRFLQQLERAGRPVCILVVSGPLREVAYFEESPVQAAGGTAPYARSGRDAGAGTPLESFLGQLR